MRSQILLVPTLMGALKYQFLQWIFSEYRIRRFQHFYDHYQLTKTRCLKNYLL